MNAYPPKTSGDLARPTGLILVSCVVAALAAGALGKSIESDAFPRDVEKQVALASCFGGDLDVRRYLAADRAACYAHALPPAQPPVRLALNRPLVPVANFVDLWRAAGRGHAPMDDVRMQEANSAFMHTR